MFLKLKEIITRLGLFRYTKSSASAGLFAFCMAGACCRRFFDVFFAAGVNPRPTLWVLQFLAVLFTLGENYDIIQMSEKLDFIGEKKMNVRLIKLSKKYYTQLSEMIDEWKLDHEVNQGNRSPWAIFKNDYHNFDYYLENLEITEPKDGKVPDSVYFLLDIERDILLGAVNIRHYLNDYLLQFGGHIGDGIRPSERRKGYATEMIRLSLIECKKLGINKVLMVCDKTNVGSAKSIIKNGGVLENEFVDDNGKTQQRYWIEVF